VNQLTMTTAAAGPKSKARHQG